MDSRHNRIVRMARPVLLALFMGFMSFVDASASDAQRIVAPQLFITKINVVDLDRSIAFYTNLLGLKELWRAGSSHAPQVLLASSQEDFDKVHRALVLVYNAERKESFILGDGLNNLTFLVPDIRQSVSRIADAGYEAGPISEPRQANSGFNKTYQVAFAKDPDGRTIELVQHD